MVRHLDPAEAVAARQRQATIKMLETGAHTAFGEGGITEATQGPRLVLKRARSLGVSETRLVLLATTLDPALRKKNIASQVMEAGQLGNKIEPVGNLLCFVEQFNCLVKTF